jgi:hypothetical protein
VPASSIDPFYLFCALPFASSVLLISVHVACDPPLIRAGHTQISTTKKRLPSAAALRARCVSGGFSAQFASTALA